MQKYLFTAFFIFLIVFSPVTAQANFETSAKQAVMLDYDTGMVLFEKNAHERMPTSSMSKVMTIYLVFEALKNGQISLDSKFMVSEKAWRKGGSKMFVEVDKRVAIEDLIRGVVIQSGNDASIVLAEGLSGSEAAFAQAMNAKAQELGMSGSNFVNSSGWPDENHYSTAYDLAVLGRALIQNFPEYYDYYSEREFTFNNITQKNRNPLLYREIGADGIKTGHTEVAGYGLIGSGTHNKRRVVFVVNGLGDERARAQEGAKLLEYGLHSFKNTTPFKAGDVIAEAEVLLGQKDKVSLQIENDVDLTVPALSGKSVTANLVYNGPLKAPIQKGEQVGELTITIPDMENVTVPVVAAEDVGEIGFLAGSLTRASLYLKSFGSDEQ